MKIIVWEWELDLYFFVPYSPEVSRLLENAFKNKKDTVNIGQADPNLSCYEVNLKYMIQTRLETGTERNIQRTLYSNSHECASGIVWEWLSDLNTWTPYDMDTAQHLEREYLKKKSSQLDLENTPKRLPNVVDFKKMIQINKYSRSERHIQRTPSAIPYPCDTGNGSSYDNTSTTSFPSLLSSSFSPIHHSSLNTSLGSTSSRHSPGLTTLSSGMSNLQSPSKQKGISTKTQSHDNKHSFGAGATGGTSFVDANDKVSRSSASVKTKSKSRVYYISSQDTQPLSHGAGASRQEGDENKSHEKKRKKVKLNGPLTPFCRDVEESTDQECSICFEKLKDVSGFHDNTSKPPDSDIKELRKCKHRFHGTCLLEFIKSASKDGWIQCPTCKAIHGVKHGNQPKEGTMDVSKNHQSLPGHHGHGMIIITYNFRTGIQEKEHPHPGKLYYASGFPRICYLPDNTKGQKVLRLLKKAWKRRLIFTVATSNTTGQDDTVVWNEIHHKTEAFSNISGHGYPDPNYLDNVLAELAVQGVDDSDDEEV